MKIPGYIISLFAFFPLIAGCLQRQAPAPIHLYSLHEAEVALSALEKKSSISLGILPFQAASSIETRILYRLSPVEISYYEYERWAEPPEEMVTRAFSESLASSGLFSNVTFGADYSYASAGWTLTGIVERFEEDRGSYPPTARLRIAIEIHRADDNALIWNKRLSSSAPLEADTRTHLALAMSNNMTRVMEEALDAISGIPSLKPVK